MKTRRNRPGKVKRAATLLPLHNDVKRLQQEYDAAIREAKLRISEMKKAGLDSSEVEASLRKITGHK